MNLKCEDCVLKCEDSNVNFGWLDSPPSLLKPLLSMYISKEAGPVRQRTGHVKR